MTLHELPEFKLLVKKKWSISLGLTCLMLIIYFGFILLIAFDKPFLARPVAKNLTIGLPLGMGVLIMAWILTGIYTFWANKYYDKRVNEVKNKIS
jgi:uncharacterized membrane protein (DUF485 family)